MPLILSPGRTYKHVLSGDRDSGQEKLPTFIFKYLSSREWIKVSEQNDRFEAATGGPEVMAVVYEVIREVLVGWENLVDPEDQKEITYDPDKLEDILTMREATELMQVAIAQAPMPEDKKKLKSPSGSGTGRGAKTVRGKQSVKTSRRKQRR